MLDAKSVMRAFVTESWVRPPADKSVRVEGCFKYLTEDYEHHMPGEAKPHIGPQAYEDILRVFYAGMPDLEMTIEEIFGEGDRVCIIWRLRGTHTGELMGFKPSGRHVDVIGVGVSTARGEQLCKTVSSFDRRSLEEQLVPLR